MGDLDHIVDKLNEILTADPDITGNLIFLTACHRIFAPLFLMNGKELGVVRVKKTGKIESFKVLDLQVDGIN